MQKIKSFLLWIWQSSADPTQVSLTVKMVGMGVLAWVSLVSNTFGVPGLAGDYSTLLESVARVVEAFLILVAAVGAVCGALRKVWITILNHSAR